MKSNLIFTVLLLIMTCNYAISAQGFKRVQVGDTPPDIKLKDFDGLKYSLNSLSGIPRLVTFWKNPSLNGSNALRISQSVFDKYGDSHNLFVLSVYCPQTTALPGDAELAGAQSLAGQNRTVYPVLIDEGLQVFNTYGVITLPTFMLVGTDGKVAYVQGGIPKFGGEKRLRKQLRAMLGVPEPVKKVVTRYIPKGKADFYFKLALQNITRNEKDKAYKNFAKSLKQDKNFAEAHAQLAQLYYMDNQPAQAAQSYQNAIELDENNIEARIKFAYLNLELELFDEALIQFDEVIERSPEHLADAMYGKGVINLHYDNLADAKASFLKAGKAFDSMVELPLNNFNRAHNYAALADIALREVSKAEAIQLLQAAGKEYSYQLKRSVQELSE